MAMAVSDDMGRQIYLSGIPRRIVSLVPSDSHTLVALGAASRIVGRTSYCEWPGDPIGDVPIVGGTKNVDPDKVMQLAPDLVIANQEENARAPLETIAQMGASVFISFPRRVHDAVAHVARLARILSLQNEDAARSLVSRGYQLLSRPRPSRAVSVFVPIWEDPLMTFSADTYASDLLAWAGAENCFGDRERKYPLAADLGRRSPLGADQLALRDLRYPRIRREEVVERAPELILLPDEPFAYAEEHRSTYRELSIPAARSESGIVLTSGKDLFWYGAWTLDALPRLRAAIP